MKYQQKLIQNQIKVKVKKIYNYNFNNNNHQLGSYKIGWI